MHTDDDIFEDLDIGEPGSEGQEETPDDGGASNGALPGAGKDPAVFDDLDLGIEDFDINGEPGADAEEEPAPSGGFFQKRKKPKELNTADSSIDVSSFKSEEKTRKKGRIKRIIAWTLVELVTLACIFVYGYGLRTWNLIQRDEIDIAAIENNNISLEKKEEMEKGYWTVAVFGVDSRSDSVVAQGLNSDVIMIVSVNKENGDIKIVSVFRDTYLNISESNTYNKINAAYSAGGPEQALAALNKNLDLNITEYVAFNWKAVAEGINILGGIDGISISKAELYYINAYITETVKVTGIGSVQLTSTGEQHLDGVQAVAYGRLRYMDNDFARTERQRNVIKAAFAKAKEADFSVLNNIMVVCFPQVATNVNFNTVVTMAQNITKYNIADTGGFPWSRGDAVIGNKGDCVIPTTLESNVKLLHEFLFGDEDYEPSDMVLTISEKIKSDSSLYNEGVVIESVATDGGVIQKPKTSTGSSSSDDDEEAATIGVDDDGTYIYPTDDDGNIIIPTDEDGNVVYPTDEDGNIIKNSKSSRPTSVIDDDDDTDSDEEDGIVEEADEPDEPALGASSTPRPTATVSQDDDDEISDAPSGTVSGNNYVTTGGPGSISTGGSENSSSGPGSSSGTGGVSAPYAVESTETSLSSDGPGSTLSSSVITSDGIEEIVSQGGPGSQ